jgi:ribosomal protein S18 acetylase RimI-like enzyme
VNGRPVGSVALRTDAEFGAGWGVVDGLRIDEPDRGRGRGTVAALASEEVLRGWGCGQVRVCVPAGSMAGLRLAAALGYTERNRHLLKELPERPPVLPAGAEGRPMREDEFARWRAEAVVAYARVRADQGIPEAEARARSEAAHRAHFPDGHATGGTAIDVLVAGGHVLGHVWVARKGQSRRGEQGSFVFDVQVAEEYRGRGHGRSLMLLAEREALAAGSRLIGLNVLAGNTPAIRLYESLGYRTVERHYAKQLL